MKFHNSFSFIVLFLLFFTSNLCAQEGTRYFSRVTSASDIEKGKHYLLIGKEQQNDNFYAYTGIYNNSYGEAELISSPDETIAIADNSAIHILLIDGSKDSYTLYDETDGYYFALTAKDTKLHTANKSSDNTAKWKITFENGVMKISNKNYSGYWIQLYKPNNSTPRFRCGTATYGPTFLYKETDTAGEDLTLSIGSSRYATLYYSDRSFIIPSGVTASTYKIGNSGITTSKTYTVGQVLPAGEAVVIEAETAGEYTFSQTNESTATDALSSLRGTDTDAMTTGGSRYYKLSLDSENNEGTIGWYWGGQNGTAFFNSAHKAYLVVPDEMEQVVNQSAYLLDEGGTTALTSFQTLPTASSHVVYDIAGRQHGVLTDGDCSHEGVSLSKGIYILGGKKIIVK